MRAQRIIPYLLIIFVVVMSGYYFYPEKHLGQNVKIDSILVIKSKRILHIYCKGLIVKSYKISLGRNPIGKKEFEGDNKTPEGQYFISSKNPVSGYYKNLGISYPNKFDIENANHQNRKPGGEIKIHGLKNGMGFLNKFQRWFDWTRGCIALTNNEVDELYNSVEIGTKIKIEP